MMMCLSQRFTFVSSPLDGNCAVALSLWSELKGKTGVAGAWGRYDGVLSILGKSDRGCILSLSFWLPLEFCILNIRSHTLIFLTFGASCV